MDNNYKINQLNKEKISVKDNLNRYKECLKEIKDIIENLKNGYNNILYNEDELNKSFLIDNKMIEEKEIKTSEELANNSIDKAETICSLIEKEINKLNSRITNINDEIEKLGE